MDLSKIKWTPANIFKATGLVLLALLVVSFLFQIVGSGFNTARDKSLGVDTQGSTPPYAPGADYYGEEDGVRLSLNNIGIPPRPGGTVGDDAEEFETTEYNVSIETRDKDDVCAQITGLKKFEHVVFERVNEHDQGCNYTFKVDIDRVDEVLAFLEEFDPKDLSETTYTIKRQIEDFTSETEILERKLESINETLENAIEAYDEITTLATRTQNAEALAKIINSKINIIERLTQERINVTAQLERLERGKQEQLDRLEYTYFYVNVYENKFVDGENIKESWKAAIKQAVRNINETLQGVTVNLLSLLFLLLQYILYFFILLFVVKYLVKATKHIWKK